jgi:hypothetical protein
MLILRPQSNKIDEHKPTGGIMIRKNITIVACALVLASASAQMRPLFDARLNLTPGKASASESALLQAQVYPLARRQWAQTCLDAHFEVVDVATGAFSRKNSRQRLILYRFGYSSRQGTCMGLVVLENQRIIQHWGYEGGVEWAIGALPDINQNDRNEVVIAGGGYGQGYSESFVWLIELGSKAPRDLGSLNIGGNDCDVDGTAGTVAKLLRVVAAKTPKFYTDTFVQPCNGSKSWTKRATAEPVKLENANTMDFIKL